MARKKTLSEKLHEQWLKDREISGKKSKSYNHLPHLKELPYDRRSTSKEELTERFNACREKFIEKTRECNDLQNQMDKDKKTLMDNINKAKDVFEKLDENRQNKAEFKEMKDNVLKEKREIMERVLERAYELGLPESEIKKIQRLDNILLDGWLNDYTIEEFNKTAGDIIDYRYDTEMDDTSWAKRVDGVADDLRMIGRNSNELSQAQSKVLSDDEEKALHNQSDDYDDIIRKAEDSYWKGRDKRDIAWKEAKDYYHEGENTTQRMRDLGLI